MEEVISKSNDKISFLKTSSNKITFQHDKLFFLNGKISHYVWLAMTLGQNKLY